MTPKQLAFKSLANTMIKNFAKRNMEAFYCETKEEMQRFLIKEAQRGSTEIEAYRNLMEILGIEYPKEKDN